MWGRWARKIFWRTALQKRKGFDRIRKKRKKPTVFADKQGGREIFLGKFREILFFREGAE